MEADRIMVNIIQSVSSKAVLKTRVGFMQLNTLLVTHWVKKNNLGSSLFSSPAKTLEYFLSVKAEML